MYLQRAFISPWLSLHMKIEFLTYNLCRFSGMQKLSLVNCVWHPISTLVPLFFFGTIHILDRTARIMCSCRSSKRRCIVVWYSRLPWPRVVFLLFCLAFLASHRIRVHPLVICWREYLQSFTSAKILRKHFFLSKYLFNLWKKFCSRG